MNQCFQRSENLLELFSLFPTLSCHELTEWAMLPIVYILSAMIRIVLCKLINHKCKQNPRMGKELFVFDFVQCVFMGVGLKYYDFVYQLQHIVGRKNVLLEITQRRIPGSNTDSKNNR